jgi:hypothetical protein
MERATREASHLGRTNLLILAVGVLAGLAYARHARWTVNPILDFRLMKIPTFGLSVVSGAFTRITGGALPFLLPMMMQIGFGFSAAHSGMITFSAAAGSVLMKLLAAPILRRFGFRTTLRWNSLIASSFLALCAAFRPGWPMLAINLILLIGGFFQSLQFTALNTVAYADIPGPRMSSATSFYAIFQQLFLSMGICAAAGFLAGSIALFHHSGPQLSDFSVAFLGVTLISFLASPVCARLPRNAGAAMTGHDPQLASD